MFLLTFTRPKITNQFKHRQCHEIKIENFYITVLTDNKTSKLTAESKDFSIIEAPIILKDRKAKSPYFEIEYNDNQKLLAIKRNINPGTSAFYHLNLNGDFFCSTHITLLRDAGVKIEENKKVMPEFFLNRFVLPPNTLYKNIFRLELGSILFFKLSKGKWEIGGKKYIQLPGENKAITSIKEVATEGLKLVSKSIEYLSPMKHNISLILSGGIDSSITTTLSNRILNIDKTYSTVYPFEDPKLNVEKEYAISASNAVNVKYFSHWFGKDISYQRGKDISHRFGKQISHFSVNRK